MGPGKITIFPFNGTLLKDVNSYVFDTTSIDDGVYDLDITAIDMANNEQTQVISFTVDHAFVELPSAISEEKPTSQNTILMMVIAIAVDAGVIILNVQKARKTSTIKS